MRERRLRNAKGEPLGQPAGGGWMYNGDDMMEAVFPPRDWGPWTLNLQTLVLYCEQHHYEVDLERLGDPGSVTLMLTHISAKGWADDATLAGLVRALADIMGQGGSTLAPEDARDRATEVATERKIAEEAYADGEES